MLRILFKRTLRDLRRNCLRYLALFALVAVSMFLIVGLISSSLSVIATVDAKAAKNNLEDGQFETLLPLSPTELEALERLSVTIAADFYLDFAADEDAVLRVMQLRTQANLAELDSGELPVRDGEAAVERIYAAAHGLKVGDRVQIGPKQFKVTGIVTTPDYDFCLKGLTDISADGRRFGTAFVTAADYQGLLASGEALYAECYHYSYRLNRRGDSIAGEVVGDGRAIPAAGTARPRNKSGAGSAPTKVGGDGADTVADAGTVGQTPADDDIGDDEDALKDRLQALTVDPADVQDAYLQQAYAQATADLYQLRDGLPEPYQDSVDEFIAGQLPEISLLTSFLPADDNPRIKAANDDVAINVRAGLLAGVIILVLIAYLLSVFTVHTINSESAMIGALYALGLRRGQLLAHYMLAPCLLCLLAGAVGTAFGLSPLSFGFLAGDTYAYFSIPRIESSYNLWLLLYGLALPPIIALAVNFAVVRRRLGQSPLALLRGQRGRPAASKLQIRGLSFLGAFQIRQFLRERRSCFAVLAGMFISLLILAIGLNCYALILNIDAQTRADTKYGYLYQYKYPTDEAPADGVPAYIVSLKKEVGGYNMDVSVIGLTADNPYFPAISASRPNELSVSQSMADKYGLAPGDKIVLSDAAADRDYGFTVHEIVPYSVGLACFMDIVSMRELFTVGENYYNAVYAESELDIESGQLYAVTPRSEVVNSAEVYISVLWSMIQMMVGCAALIFLIVLYQMTKVMVDRAAYSISLMKVFGYRERELRRLYLDGSLILVALGSLALIPLSKAAMDAVYPLLIANVATGGDLTWPPQFYILTFAGSLLGYLLIRAALMRRVRRVVPAEALKAPE